MKKLFLVQAVLLFSLALYAQDSTQSIEQYCQVIATPRLFSNKVTIDIDFGEHKSYWKDDRLKTMDGKLKKFNTIIDAMNYMGQEGWVFINAYPVKTGTNEIYHFAFRKTVRIEARQLN